MSEIQCQYCKLLLPDRSRFCGYCGNLLEDIPPEMDLDPQDCKHSTPRNTDETVISKYKLRAYPKEQQDVVHQDMHPPADNKKYTYPLQHAPTVPGTPHHPRRQALTKHIRLLSVIAVAMTAIITAVMGLQLAASAAAPKLTATVGSDGVFPGSAVKLHGTQFSKGRVVTFAINDMSIDATTVVKDGSTFDVTITLPQDLPETNIYTIRASENNDQRTVTATVAVMHQDPAPTSCITTTPATLNFTLTEGQSTSVQKAVKVTNCGNTAGIVSVFPTTEGRGKWLATSPSNVPLDTKDSQDVSLVISGKDLKAGTYKGQAIFTLGLSSKRTSITLTVTARTQTICHITATTSTLGFEMVSDKANPAAQELMISGNDCETGTMLLTPTTNKGGPWLDVSPKSIPAHAIAQPITITPSGKRLAPGVYTGQVTILSGSASETIGVTFVVSQETAPPPTCIIAVTPTNFTFEMEEHKANPAAKTMTLSGSNCGTGVVSLSPSTNSGGNWLDVNPKQVSLDTNNQNIAFTLSGKGLSSGAYTGQVSFTIGSVNKVVGITLNVRQPSIVLPCTIVTGPSNLVFEMDEGKIDPGTKVVTVTGHHCDGADIVTISPTSNRGGSWLTVDPRREVLENGHLVFSVAVSGRGLKAHTYTGQVMVTIGSRSEVVGVTFQVKAGPPPPTVTPSPTEQVIPTATPSPTEQVVPTVTSSPTEQVIPTATPSPTEQVIPTATPSPTEQVVPTTTPSPTESVVPTVTPPPTEPVVPTTTPPPTEEPSEVS
jgi:hypothetical protein